MRESRLEEKLKKHIESKGGKCLKFVSPGMAGVTDRLCLLPKGRVIFAEVKAPGKTPRPLQSKRHQELLSLGFDVRVIDSEDKIHEVFTT